MSQATYTVIGATGGPGLGIFLALAALGHRVIGIGRDPGKIGEMAQFILDQGCEGCVVHSLDMERPPTHFGRLIGGTTHLIHATKSQYLQAALGSAHRLERLIVIGSTRIHSRFPDERRQAMQAMQALVMDLDVPATVLHPTLIYGGAGYANIERVKRMIRLTPVIPLPAGGAALIQPVHNDDVLRCVLACLARDETAGKIIDIAGPVALSYRDFVSIIGRSMQKQVGVIKLPLALLYFLAAATRWLPFIPSIQREEIQRLTEDKAFDIRAMTEMLDIHPMSLEDGLRLAADERSFTDTLTYFYTLNLK